MDPILAAVIVSAMPFITIIVLLVWLDRKDKH